MSDQEEEQQWIVVKPHKKKRIEKQIKPERVFAKGGRITLEENQQSDIDEAFISSASFKKNYELLQMFLRHFEGGVQVYCLGIGNFDSNLKPYLQLLFLKNNIVDLLQKLKITFSVNIYDPVMSEKELSLVKASGWRCDELKNVEKDLSYIFFMPHCQRFLHEKVCSLRHQIRGKRWLVIGNSINDYKERSKLLGEEVPESFQGVEPKDIKLVDFKQALNDTFIYEL